MQRILLSVLGLAAMVGSAPAQQSEYYLVDGGNAARISVIQNGAVVRTWSTTDSQMPVAVIDTVRTYGQYSTNKGAEYDLDGTPTGVEYRHQGEVNVSQSIDGGTDGVEYNFLAAYGHNSIWRFDLDWKNPEQLFSVSGPTGITYDQASGNLWVISFVGKNITEYTMDGNVVRQFGYSSPSSWLGALAYEPATDTLWAEEFSTGTLYQYSKDGQTLQSFVVPGIGGYAWGAEFAAAGGIRCHYTIKKSKAKGGCDTCPAKGDDYRTEAECETPGDCAKKIKTTIACPRGGNGVCKVKGKRSGCE